MNTAFVWQMIQKLNASLLLSFMFSLSFSSPCIGQTKAESTGYSKNEVEQAFKIAQQIPFYSYGDKENYPYASLSFPYCAAGAAVIGNEITKAFQKPVQQIKIYLSHAYFSHCSYPTAYTWHTAITLKDLSGTVFVIDPAHVERALTLNDYLKEYVRRDCKRLSLTELDNIAKEVGSSAIYQQKIETSGKYPDIDERFRALRVKDLMTMISGKSRPLPPGPMGIPAPIYLGQMPANVRPFLENNLLDRYFIYVFELSSMVTEGSHMSPVDLEKDQEFGFLEEAYSWVVPQSLRSKLPIYSHEATPPFMTEKTFNLIDEK